jgi:uncharacterized protein (TIRG00374 family)
MSGKFAIKGYMVWGPILGLLAVDLLYQTGIVWKQWDVLSGLEPWFLLLAVINQLAVYVVLVPAMQDFYASSGIQMSGKRSFSLLAMGLAFSRIVPVGEYIIWRASLRGKPGAASATTQWLIMYYSFMFCGVVAVFLLMQVLTVVLYPNAHANTLVGELRFLPVVLVVIGAVLLSLTRFGWMRRFLRRFTYDKIGSQAVSPLGIIKDRKLTRNTLGWLIFASVATWMIEGLTLFLCLRSLGLEVPLVMAVAAFTFARLFALFPVVPGGAGQIEAGVALLLLAYNYPFGTVFTAAVLYRLVTYWPPLLLGAYSYLRSSDSKRLAAGTGSLFAAQLLRRRS